MLDLRWWDKRRWGGMEWWRAESHSVGVPPSFTVAGLEVRERSELLQLDFQGYPLLQQVLEGT